MEQELDLGLEEAKLQTVDLQKELLVLRLAFGKLKATAYRAFEPITAGVVNALSKAVFWAIRLMKNIGYIIAGVTGLRAKQDKLTQSVTKTYKAVRRELAGFDELNRLGTPKDSTVTTQIEIAPGTFAIPEHLQGIIDGILEALRPLQEFDLFDLRWHFHRMKEAVEELFLALKNGAGWAWHQLLVPFAQWIVEQFVPQVFHTLEGAAKLLTAVLEPLGKGFGKLLEAMKPIFKFVGDCLLTCLEQLRLLFVSLAQVFQEKGTAIEKIFENLSATISHIWKIIGPKLEALRLNMGNSFGAISKDVSLVVGKLIDAFEGLSEFLLGAFTGNWQKAWDGMKKFLKNSINGILALINGMLSGLAEGLNAVVNMLNKLKFTLPDWIPDLGGKSFGLNLPKVKALKIPYLAKGAVLPANKPFLAMVGDQKHGTNIEAPLTTIQEAVGRVLGDMVPAMVAGFEALLRENVALRQTVEGISVGDETLARAVNRYNAKMEIVRGV